MKERKTILVVDDEPDAIKFVEAVLNQDDSFTIIASPDGDDGLQKALNLSPDLIILDVMLPGKDGFKVFYELKKDNRTKDIPIIMLTGVADKIGIRFFKDDMKNFMGKEPVDYIEKPLDPQKLLDSVSRVLSM